MGWVMAAVVLSFAASAVAEEEVRRVALVVPAVPAALEGVLREGVEAMVERGLAVGELVAIGGAVREPCGIVVREGDRVIERTSLVWRARRIVSRTSWAERNAGSLVWSRSRSLFRDGLEVRVLSENMQYRDGQAECPNWNRRVVTRDGRGRIVSVRSTVETCEGVDSGTWVHRYVWGHRVGFEEAVVRSRNDRDGDRPADLSRRAFVPSERDAWAELADDAGGSVDLRDADGFLRVHVEDGVGEYVYACDGAEWPHETRAPDVAPLRSP